MQPSVGFTQAGKTQVGEVPVGPTLMVRATAAAAPTRALTQNTAQPTAKPAIQGREHVPVTMAKISKPSLQRPVQRPDDPRQAVPVGATRLRSEGVFELVQALLPRQPQSA